MRTILIGLSAVVLACALGCRGEDDQMYMDEGTGLVMVPDEDPEMDAAIAKAKSSIDDFIAHLKSPKPNMSMFAVKKPYPTRSGSVEHIWVEVSGFSNGSFSGVISNDPVDIEGITMGTPVSVAKSEITDWLIMTDAEPLGGYTVAVMEKRISNE